MHVLAIIPARGGSKSIPRKNIKLLSGHPLIAYSIAAGRQAKLVTRTVISTDDEEIAAVARRYGAEAPFLRPAEFAQDHTTDFPVFTHALGWLAEHEDYYPDIVVQLRPTSPIRPVEMVDQAVRSLLDNPQVESVRGVVPAGQNPFKMWRIIDGRMVPLLTVEGIAEPYNAPRQALPAAFWQTGHIDAIRVRTILEKGSLSGQTILPLMIDPRYTIDIDTLNDWQRAERLMADLPALGLDFVRPGPLAQDAVETRKRPLPTEVRLIVFDFDGVMTDNRVWVDQDGREMVAANRSDSMGLKRLRNTGVQAMVLSTEVNPVVTARCRKMDLPVVQGLEDKALVLKKYLEVEQIDPSQVVYVGNDINDLGCFPLVGCAVVVADAQPEAMQQADMVLSQRGGHGAVREICDLIFQRKGA
jgi:N-acylneuraminate cytidylyltransferase